MIDVFRADCADRPVPMLGADLAHLPSLVWGPDQQRNAFLYMINSAEKSIHVYQQDFTDEGITQAVSGAARRGIKVQIIMMPFPFSKKEDKNILNQQMMIKAGAMVGLNTSNYMHSKILIIDGKMMYVGSCNFYTPSLDQPRELGIVTDNHAPIEKVLGVFYRDWNKSTMFEGAKDVKEG